MFSQAAIRECYHVVWKNNALPRIAWFSPMPPSRTGVATYSADVIEALREDHQIVVYPEGRAHDFIWTHLKQPYDLIVYQLGNSTLHEYIWPYLFRYPGLVVLHDARLHQAPVSDAVVIIKPHAQRSSGPAESDVVLRIDRLLFDIGMTVKLEVLASPGEIEWPQSRNEIGAGGIVEIRISDAEIESFGQKRVL